MNFLLQFGRIYPVDLYFIFHNFETKQHLNICLPEFVKKKKKDLLEKFHDI